MPRIVPAAQRRPAVRPIPPEGRERSRAVAAPRRAARYLRSDRSLAISLGIMSHQPWLIKIYYDELRIVNNAAKEKYSNYNLLWEAIKQSDALNCLGNGVEGRKSHVSVWKPLAL